MTEPCGWKYLAVVVVILWDLPELLDLFRTLKSQLPVMSGLIQKPEIDGSMMVQCGLKYHAVLVLTFRAELLV
jgi:hypothetical protein